MAEMSEVFPPAGNLALEVVFTVVVSMEAEVSMAVVVDIGERRYRCMEFVENPRMKGTTMPQNISIIDQLEWKKFIRLVGFVLSALSLGAFFVPTFAQDSGQQTFASVADAGRAFFTAMQAPDDRSILKILGAAGNEIVSSGDPIEDLDARTNFTAKYEEMHRFVTEPNGTVTLVVGAENWPLPIPLVNKNGAWYFDAQAGKDEILFRRIGKNELFAIQACGDLVDAQKQYYDKAPYGYAKEYAQKLVSDEGKHNGLYWDKTGDQFESPINPLIAYARQNRPASQVGARVPFNGYFFRILTSQGPHAPGGAKNYVLNGKMTTGFAFVAYPAEYRSSGVMTFIVNQSGTIYEKDLGPNTTKGAEVIIAYDPDSTWHKAE
jgi:hypothetical protein